MLQAVDLRQSLRCFYTLEQNLQTEWNINQMTILSNTLKKLVTLSVQQPYIYWGFLQVSIKHMMHSMNQRNCRSSKKAHKPQFHLIWLTARKFLILKRLWAMIKIILKYLEKIQIIMKKRNILQKMHQWIAKTTVLNYRKNIFLLYG